MVDQKKVACLDIDDTLVDFISHLIHIHNFRNNTKIRRSDISEYSLTPELMATFKDYESWLYVSAPVLPKVKQKLKDLRDKGYHIMLMTARDEEFKKHTEFNLAHNGIEYDELFFNKNKSLKINRLPEEYNVAIFADDKLSTVNNVKEKTDVAKVYLINMPSNRNEEVVEGVIRINNINEIEED